MAKSHKRENYMNRKIIPARRTEKVTYAIRDIAVKAKHLEDQGQKNYILKYWRSSSL